MGRIKTQLNIPRQPGVGMAYVAKRQSDGAIVRVATLCARDQKAQPDLAPIRKFSGDEPFFKARITRGDGGVPITPFVLQFDCRSGNICTATANGETYEWLDLDHKVALNDGLAIVNDTPPRGTDLSNIVVDEEEAPLAVVEETDFVDLDDLQVSEQTMAEVVAHEDVDHSTEEVVETQSV